MSPDEAPHRGADVGGEVDPGRGSGLAAANPAGQRSQLSGEMINGALIPLRRRATRSSRQALRRRLAVGFRVEVPG